MATKPFKHSPEAIAFLKKHIPDMLQQGQTVAAALKGLGVSTRMLIRWRRDDIEFDRAVLAALTTSRSARVAGNRAVSTSRRGEEGTRLLQDRLIEHIEAGERPTHAAANIGVSYRQVQAWCRADPQFGKEFDEAVAALTHMELDRLADLHEEIPDAKVAMVAGKHLESWISKRNRVEFGPKAEPEKDSQPQLLSILQAAVQRLIDQVPPAPATPLTAVEPARRVVFKGNDPEDEHRP